MTPAEAEAAVKRITLTREIEEGQKHIKLLDTKIAELQQQRDRHVYANGVRKGHLECLNKETL